MECIWIRYRFAAVGVETLTRSEGAARGHVWLALACARAGMALEPLAEPWRFGGRTLPVIERIAGYADELTAIRRDLHAHPEIGFEEHRTSARIAELLAGWGIDVTQGVGRTGVVGVLDGQRPGRTIGLRADMDALPMEELTNLPYRSTNPGVFHGCGHDGHVTMLLGAARYLAETRDFGGAGGLHLPAGGGGAGRRAGDAGGRALRAVSLRRALRAAQFALRPTVAGADPAGAGAGRGGVLRHRDRGAGQPRGDAAGWARSDRDRRRAGRRAAADRVAEHRSDRIRRWCR